MDTFSLIVEILIILLVIALLVTLIRYPKEIILGIIKGVFSFIHPDILRPITWIFLPVWLIGHLISRLFNSDMIEYHGISGYNPSEKPYKNLKKRVVDFDTGEKFISCKEEQNQCKNILQGYLEYCENYVFEEFDFNKTGLIKCPDNISFYDFCILVQHFCNTSKNDVYGVFISDNLRFYAYQDDKTTHNLIGRTNDNKTFSIYTLDDLNNKVFLRMNPGIKVRNYETI